MKRCLSNRFPAQSRQYCLRQNYLQRQKYLRLRHQHLVVHTIVGPTIDHIVTEKGFNAVRAIARVDRIVAVAAKDKVITGTGVYEVVAVERGNSLVIEAKNTGVPL